MFASRVAQSKTGSGVVVRQRQCREAPCGPSWSGHRRIVIQIAQLVQRRKGADRLFPRHPPQVRDPVIQIVLHSRAADQQRHGVDHHPQSLGRAIQLPIVPPPQALIAPVAKWTMATFSKPPCDEAAILAPSCERPDATNGPWILAATILGSSMAFIDGTVVNVALPALQSALGATLADVQWVVEAYALFLAALLLIGGSLGDLYGRRRIFAAGVVLFSAASAWCGLAPDIRQLISRADCRGSAAHCSSPAAWP